MHIGQRVERQLRALSKLNIERVVAGFEKLAENPRPHGSSKLKGRAEVVLKIRFWDYRVLYTADDDYRTVTVQDIGPRDKVYKKKK